jgi:hypothetical protein
MFTAQYGLIPYMKHITFRLLKVKLCCDMFTIQKLLRDNELFIAGGIQMGHAVAHLVQTLHYKPAGRGFDSLLCHWNFFLT